MAKSDDFELLPEYLRNEDSLRCIDDVCDVVAIHTRWSSTDVGAALCRLLHLLDITRPGDME